MRNGTWFPALLAIVLMALFISNNYKVEAQPRRSVQVIPANGAIQLGPTSRVVGVACAAPTSNYSIGNVQCYVAIEQ